MTGFFPRSHDTFSCRIVENVPRRKVKVKVKVNVDLYSASS